MFEPFRERHLFSNADELPSSCETTTLWEFETHPLKTCSGIAWRSGACVIIRGLPV